MMTHMVNRFSLSLSIIAMLACFNSSWSQSDDYAAKASIIDGIRAFEAGEEGADSLFFLGERHSNSPRYPRPTPVAHFSNHPNLVKKPVRPFNGPSNRRPMSSLHPTLGTTLGIHS